MEGGASRSATLASLDRPNQIIWVSISLEDFTSLGYSGFSLGTIDVTHVLARYQNLATQHRSELIPISWNKARMM